MRLNRVLQTKLNRVSLLTAGICIAMAAAIFTISCGEDGAEGAPGASCVLSGTSVPYTVICSGVEVGLVDGGPGEPGLTGDTGPQGNGCSLTPSGSSYIVSCGGSVQGTLDGCSIVSNASNIRETVISCGSTKVSLCDNQIFDPSEEYCPATGAATSVSYCGPDSIAYNPVKKYCGFKDSTTWKAGKVEVLDLCGTTGPNKALEDATDSSWKLVGSTGNSLSDSSSIWLGEFCQISRNPSYDPADDNQPLETKNAAYRDTCNGVVVSLNKDTWKGEYCGFASKTAAVKTVLTDACGDGTEPNKTAYADGYCAIESKDALLTSKSEIFCGPVKLGKKYPKSDSAARKLNASTVQSVLPAGSWKGEYCGYTLANFAKTVKGFTGDSAYRATAAGSSAGQGAVGDPKSTGVDSTLYLSKITATKACDSSSAASSENVAPNDSAAYDFTYTVTTWNKKPIWLNQYCQVGSATAKSKPVPDTVVAIGDLSAYCAKAADTAYYALAATARLNEGSWKGEACVFANLAAYPKIATGPDRNGSPTVVKNTACGDGQVPNDANLSNYSKATTNGGYTGDATYDSTSTGANFHQPFWRNQYCQYDSSTGTTKRVGITLAGSTNSRRTIKALTKYCLADTAAMTNPAVVNKDSAYLADLQKANTANHFINAGATSNQYCGFENRAALQSNDTAAATIKFKRLTTCTNGEKPNSAEDIEPVARRQLIRNPLPDDGLDSLVFWKNEFCQYDPSTGGTKKVGLDLKKTGNIFRDTAIFLKYCPGDTALALDGTDSNKAYIRKFQGVVGGSSLSTTSLFKGSITKLNAGTVSNQYCGIDSWANDTAKSTFTVPTTGDTAKAKYVVKNFKVLTNARCGDGKAVNALMDDDGTARTAGWLNEYCQVQRNSNGVSVRVGGADYYCLKDVKKGDDYVSGVWEAAAANSFRLNENSYKGQFCFEGDQTIGTCSGGWVGVTDKKSTDPSDVRCELP